MEIEALLPGEQGHNVWVDTFPCMKVLGDGIMRQRGNSIYLNALLSTNKRECSWKYQSGGGR